MNSKLVILGFGVLLFIGTIGMGFIDNAYALKSKGNHLTTYGSSSGVCGDKLCSEIELPHHESKKSEHMKMEQDKMMINQDKQMMDGTMMDVHVSLDGIVKLEIQSILDQTNYSSDGITDTIVQLDNYLSTLDESSLQQKTIKEITNIVFYAQHEQMPTEFAIYEIYEFLK